MTPRDNLLSMYRRQGYEYAPIDFGFCPSLEERFRKETGSELPSTEYFNVPFRGIAGPKAPERAPIDWTVYFPGGVKPGTIFDEWGVGHEPGSESAHHMTRMRHPLEPFDSLEQLQAYPFPDYENATTAHIREKSAEIQAQGFASCGWGGSIWEQSWYMRGMEQLMMDMASEDEMATYLLDLVTRVCCIRAAEFAKAGTDLLMLGDDIGMQSSLMMREDFYREWIKPRLKRVIDSAREVKPDIIVTYHSCGYVKPLIGDLIEAGIDVLNPVQPECMDFSEIHAEFGDRVSFWGTVGTQTTMPFGSPDDVRAVVKRNLDIAGEKGGLLCAPTHMLEPEVPWENVIAYIEACRDYRPGA